MTQNTYPYVLGIWQQATIANGISLSRVLAVIPLVVTVFYEQHLLAFLVVAAAGISDWLDGWYARRTGSQTPLGRVLDPLADKWFVNMALLIALLEYRLVEMLVLWIVTMLYDIDNTYRRGAEIERAFRNVPGDEPDHPATMVSKMKTAMMFVLLAACYGHELHGHVEAVTLLTQLTLALVLLSWGINRFGSWIGESIDRFLTDLVIWIFRSG